MHDFNGKIAVVTGGGNGMGRELVVQLVAAGAHVATCDLSSEDLAETVALARASAPASDVRISTHLCDVSDQSAMEVFRDEVLAAHDTDHIHLLFNNAGIGGGGSVFTHTQAAWERCFDVCFHGVRYGVLAFLDALVAADESRIVNTSSVNGFWASLGPDTPHTAYSSAKFAVKGFSEALITDLRVNAPHVSVSVVMPGHIGTDITANSMRWGGMELTDEERELGLLASEMFRTTAPTSAAEAATIILDGVRAGRWRILVGDDAHALDEVVRNDPEGVYEADFVSPVLGAARAANEETAASANESSDAG